MHQIKQGQNLDLDGLYSNVANRFVQNYLGTITDPKSGAILQFTAMAGHEKKLNDKAVLMMVSKKAVGK